MLRNEYLNMLSEDMVTNDDYKIAYLFECVKTFLNKYPSSTQIDSSKSLDKLYEFMEDYAKEHASDGLYCVCGTELDTLLKTYFNLNDFSISQNELINLEDFI